MKFKEYFFCFCVGGIVYGLIETVVRGYTHWSMVLTGGAVLVLMNLINQTKGINIFVKCLLGTVIITSLEYSVGMIVNVALGWDVWDYSDKPFNLFGQICPQFCAAWFLLSIPAYALCSFISRKFSFEKYSS